MARSSNKTAIHMGKRATRNESPVVIVPLAAADLAAAVYCNLNLERENLGVDEYVALYQGAYSLVLDIIASKPVSGLVPLPIFQLLAALRPRVVNLGAQAVYSLNPDPDVTKYPTLPPAPTQTDYSYFTQRAASLSGVLLDLSDIAVNQVGPFPDMGYPSAISVGASMGPLNYFNPQNSRYSVTRIRTKNMPPTEAWMSYFSWANNFIGTHALEIEAITFPLLKPGSEITPGTMILSTALRRADVIGCTSFDFPALDLSLYKAFIDANLRARIDANGGQAPTGYHYDLRLALAVVSGVGLRAGQIAFASAYHSIANFQSPQDINEAGLALPTFREKNCRIPYVYTRTALLPDVYQIFYADGTEDGIQFANAATDTAPRKIGISNAEMSLGSSAFLNNTFDLQQNGTQLTYTGVEPTWGGASTVTAAAPAAFDWSANFRLTISNGPLSRPSGDKVMCTLNMADLTAGLYSVTDSSSKLSVAGYANISSFAAGLQGSNLPLLASLPLPREAVLANDKITPNYHQVPIAQAQVKIASPAVSAAYHTVTEDSAKYTEIQQLFENMQVNGYGGAGLWGDITKKSRQVDFVRAKVTALGFALTGKTLKVDLKTRVNMTSARKNNQARASKKTKARQPMKNKNMGQRTRLTGLLKAL